jgi:UDP-galactopyranose mutase
MIEETAPVPDFDVVCLSHLRWDFVWQRPQHLLKRWAAERRVFYVEEAIFDGTTRVEVREAPEGVFVVVPHLPERTSLAQMDAIQQTLLDELFVQQEIDDYLLWVYAPMAANYVAHLRPLATVYDCMDELSAFADAPRELKEREAELLRRADVVFTGGRSLYEAKRNVHANVHAFPSAVEREHFARALEAQPDPPDQRSIAAPRLGFYGVIDERLDLELVRELADACPHWQIVLVGPVVKIPVEALPQRPNIHYLGAKPYDELPRYLAGWDVAIMPFALNEATRFISPTKTLEFLAAGRPVVATPVRDVVTPYGEDGLVTIAETVEQTIDAVEAALAAGGPPPHVDDVLARASWDDTFARMRALVDVAVAEPPRPTTETSARRPFDFLVVGAGFAGSVVAERLAAAGRRVLIVDRRSHVAGNAYDRHDAAGILVHRYGPHIFHTNSSEVFGYLSAFTEWRPYEHRVRASVDGKLLPIPINLDTINELYNLNLSTLEVEEFFESVAEPVEHVRTSEDVVVSKVGRDLYLKFFRNYTRKQWGLDPSELDASVTARVPTRTTRDDRYFADTYQAMPLQGYTQMFERLLDHPNIKVLLQTDYRELAGLVSYRELVYSGPVDEYFNFRYGKLPYRSLEFRFATHDCPFFQSAPVVNFPNEHPYTRCTEFKYLTGQEHAKTTVVYEYPRDEGDPYYPVPRPENALLYKRYKALADAADGVHFVGRLATYKYYNMDQVVAQALALARRILGKHESIATGAVGGIRVHGQPRRRPVLRSTRP